MADNKLSPPSATPICDPKTGVVRPEWRLWLNRIYQRVGASEAPSNSEIGEESKGNAEKIEQLEQGAQVASANIESLEQDVSSNRNSIAAQQQLVSEASAASAVNTAAIVEVNADLDKVKASVASAIQSNSNVGSGVGVFQATTGTAATFKTLKAGANITLDDTTVPNEILISAGGSSTLSKGFGDLTLIGSLVGSGSGSGFSVNGGPYWTAARKVATASLVTVPTFNSSSQVSNLAANQTYYIIFDFTDYRFKFTTTAAFSNKGNAKLMWTITTNATMITGAIDYRAMDLYVSPRTFLATAPWVTGVRAYSFPCPLLANLNQKPVSGEISGTVFPRYSRWQVNLICTTADNGYAVGDEVCAITCNMHGLGYTCGPLGARLVNATGALVVLQENETKFQHATTNSWAIPTAGCWSVVVKASVDYH